MGLLKLWGLLRDPQASKGFPFQFTGPHPFFFLSPLFPGHAGVIFLNHGPTDFCVASVVNELVNTSEKKFGFKNSPVK